MSEKEVKLTGGALVKPRVRRGGSTRKNRQQGGDNSGALLQLKGQSVEDVVAPQTQQLAASYAGAAGQLLQNTFGPDKIQQFGGKKKQQGGDGTAGTIQKAANYAPTTPGAPPPQATVSGISPSQPAPVGGGRVILAPPKRKTRIALKAKKLKGGSDSAGDLPPNPNLGGGTRKARKIHLRVKGVTSRLAKAKKAKKVAMAAPLAQVKSKLESAGIIKKGSKAPESMLRTMYADLLITKKGL